MGWIMVILLSIAFYRVDGIESVTCADAESEWGQGVLSNCTVKLKNDNGNGVISFDCYERNGTSLPWVKIGNFSASGHVPHESHRGKLRNTHSTQLTFKRNVKNYSFLPFRFDHYLV